MKLLPDMNALLSCVGKVHVIWMNIFYFPEVSEGPIPWVWPARGPDMNGDSFFKQLKQLCRVVEQGLQGVTQETENNQSKRGTAGAIKRLVDLKSDIQDMQVKKQCLCVSITLSVSLVLSLFLFFSHLLSNPPYFFLPPLSLLSFCLIFLSLSLNLLFSLSLLWLYLWIKALIVQLDGNSCIKIAYVKILLQKSKKKYSTWKCAWLFY